MLRSAAREVMELSLRIRNGEEFVDVERPSMRLD
jgi:hypothetical protein